VRQRLRQNAAVVGTDEAFFEDDTDEGAILNLYHEKAGILDGEADTEVDLASYAYQIWKNAIDRDPSVKAKVENLPPVVYSTRNWTGRPGRPPGSLVYTRTPAGNDSLAWMDEDGHTVTGSQLAILQAAECEADTPAGCPNPHPLHHALVAQGLQEIGEVERNVGGQLGRPGGARFRTYERLQGYAAYLSRMGPIFSATQAAVEKAMDDLYRAPLLESAAETINRQIKSGINDDELADLVLRLRDDDRFCQRRDEDTGDVAAPQIICSLGLFPSHGH